MYRYTHVHNKIQILIKPDATQTAAEETRLDSCNRSQKIKTATFSDWSFLYVHKKWIVTKKKGTVLVKEEKWAKPSRSNENAVMFYTILSVISFSCIDFISVFGYKKSFKLKWPQPTEQNNYSEKPFSMEDVRNLKTLGLAQSYHVQISTLFMFKIKTEKKKTFWSTLMWQSIWGVGATFFFEHLIDVFCYLLSFCYLLAEWLAVNTRMCTDQTSGHARSRWSLLWWLLKGEPISLYSRHSVVIRFEETLFPAQKCFLSHCILVWKGIWALFCNCYCVLVHKHTHTCTHCIFRPKIHTHGVYSNLTQT